MFQRVYSKNKLTVKVIREFGQVLSRSNSTTVANVTSQRLQLLEQRHKEDENTKPDNWYNAKPFSEIPGPKPLPLIGNVWRFLPIIGEFYGKNFVELSNWLQKYGKVVSIPKFLKGRDMVFLYNPEDFEMVFRNEGIFPERNTMESIQYYQRHVRKDIYGNKFSLVASSGKDWYQIRSLANPIMNQIRSVENYIPEIDKVTQDFSKRVRFLMDNKKEAVMPETFMNELNKWALESVSFIALDKRLGCLEQNLAPDSEAQKAINGVHDILNMLYYLEFRPSLWKYFNTKSWKTFQAGFDTVNTIFSKYIQEAKDKNQQNPSEETKSMLQSFLSINEELAHVMALDLLMAGVDTTSKTAGAIMYFLSSNKRVQEELRKELISLLPQKDAPFTKEILSNAKYLKATIKEGLRLGGIAMANLRKATKDLVVAGYQIPKGTLVQMCGYQNIRSEKWFSSPEEFMPERWLRSNNSETSFKNSNPFTYLPFGFGKRSCIGQRIATMELEILTARMVRDFNLDWPHPPAKFVSKLLYEIGDPVRIQVREVI